MSTRDLVVDSDITTLNDDAFALYYLVALGRVPAVVTTVFGNTSARLSAEAARALFVDTSVTGRGARRVRASAGVVEFYAAKTASVAQSTAGWNVFRNNERRRLRFLAPGDW